MRPGGLPRTSRRVDASDDCVLESVRPIGSSRPGVAVWNWYSDPDFITHPKMFAQVAAAGRPLNAKLSVVKAGAKRGKERPAERLVRDHSKHLCKAEFTDT